MEKPGVMMFSWEYPPRIIGGIAAHVYDLSLALSRLNFKVHVVTCDFPGASENEEIEGVAVHRIDSYRFPAPDFASWVFMMNINMLRQAVSIFKKHKINIIHAHDWLVAKAAIGLKHLFRVPLVVTIHSTEFGRRNGIYTDYQRMIHQTEIWLSHESWKVICCSNYMADHVSKVLSLTRKNIITIPNGVDLNKFITSYDKNFFRSKFARPDEKLIIFVGRLVYEKGAHILVNAAQKVLQKVNAKFIIVGEGYLKDDLIRQASALGLDEKIFFTGFLDDSEVKFLYRTADLCVIPSLYEPFGIVALEAMAAKTPIVTTGIGGLSEIIEHDKTGVIIYPDNPESLAWGIIRVLTDKEYSEKISSNAFNKVLSYYNWKGIAEKTINVYYEVLNEYDKGKWKPS